MHKSLVIIPTYNEKENIQKIVNAVMALDDFHVLVVDDSSPDGTAELVRELQGSFHEQLHLEIRKNKNGLGKAYIHGFHWALDKGYDLIFEMDADFSHSPNDLPKLREALIQGADVAVGSRYINGVRVLNWPMRRLLISFFASIYVQLVTGLKLRDSTAGFVGYKKEVLQKLKLHKIRFKGYGFQVEMKYKAWKLNYNIVEVPIVFTERTQGKSKISGNIISEAIIGILMLRIRYLLGRLF